MNRTVEFYPRGGIKQLVSMHILVSCLWCDVWKGSILHVNCSRLLARWDLGVLAHNERFKRLEVFMGNENESMKITYTKEIKNKG